MDLLLALATLVLCAVFVIAAIGKLTDRSGTAVTLRQFGVPEILARPLGLLLPYVELTVSVLLIVPTTSAVGVIVALGLLLLFSLAIGANLLAGRAPQCHCFGQLHSSPAGWRTLARNGFLAGLAGWLAISGGATGPVSPWSLAGDVPVLVVVGVAIALAACVQTWLLVHVLRQHGRLLIRLDALEAAFEATGLVSPPQEIESSGLTIGADAPKFEAPSLTATVVSLDQLLAFGRPLFLAFSDPDCAPCNELLPNLAFALQTQRNSPRLVVVSRGSVNANRHKLTNLPLNEVLLQRDREIADAYGVTATPAAVVIRSDGKIGSPLALGPQAIARLLASQGIKPQAGPRPEPQRPTALSLGEKAPAFALRDLEGELTALADLAGRPTMLMFWNPTCSYCVRMLPDVMELERQGAEGSAGLVFISRGTPDANRAMRLQSRILLDEPFTLGNALGVRGTPSAILLGSNGQILSNVAIGAEQIVALYSSVTSSSIAGAAAT